ncbi:MAG: carboxymuconolactone decarboxylase family protein [Xanthobacteraceae bacterium]|nr:carboxymuconolactone decarboxylase family protein [Xanthobacteraceae bacterium]
MTENWPATTAALSAQLRSLRGTATGTMKTFSQCAENALRAGALDTKTKELMALAIGIAVRCDDCIAFHAKAAVQHGATREEIQETLELAIYMGAGPSVMYASHALRAFDEFAAQRQAAE